MADDQKSAEAVVGETWALCQQSGALLTVELPSNRLSAPNIDELTLPPQGGCSAFGNERRVRSDLVVIPTIEPVGQALSLPEAQAVRRTAGARLKYSPKQPVRRIEGRATNVRYQENLLQVRF